MKKRSGVVSGSATTTSRYEEDAACVAATVHRLAVLLETGVPPARAWALLADDGDPVARDVAEGAPQHTAGEILTLRGGVWREVAIAWRVAESVGAPLAESLRRCAQAVSDAQQVRDDVAVALADPAATARLVSWLPLVGIALGVVMGFDVVAVLTQPAGWVCCAAGAALMYLARRWTVRLVSAAQPSDLLPGMASDTLAIALSSGASVDRAVAVVAASGGGALGIETQKVIELSQRAGAPAVEMLRAAATQERRRARTQGRLAAARLGSRLLLPMGLCTLPAFLLVGVAPMLLSVVAGSGTALTAPPSCPPSSIQGEQL